MSASPAPARPEAAAYGPSDLAAQLDLTPGQIADLERFRAILEDANAMMNLVGPSAMADFWRRHALDSAQLRSFAPEARVWADLGAGAGFPGLVLAILLKGVPDAQVLLVESMAKRCGFLSRVATTLDLPAEVIHARAEAVTDRRVEVVTARACAPMERLLAYARPWLKNGAQALFLKGENVEIELHEAAKTWTFDAELQPSSSDPKGRVVRLRRLSRAR
jgi:16S rRNA (guanine527-N7)-methyltransferase